MLKSISTLTLILCLGPLMAQDRMNPPPTEGYDIAAVLDSIIQAQHLKNDSILLVYSAADSLAFFRPPADTLKKRLSLLDQKTILDSRYNPSLESVIKLFLKTKRPLLEKMLLRSQLYFPMFEREFDALEIPLEMKYLAIVESALDPRAKSRVGATGLWQFMYGTGKMLGLEVNNYIDERQDPLKATKAAAVYLKKLYGMFGDWNLALAAYNSGPGNVKKAIKRSGGSKNFWVVRNFLPKETAGYVPALITTMYLFEYASDHGLRAPIVALPPYILDTLHLKKGISFKQLSKALSLPVEAIFQLNPVYKLGIVPEIEGKKYPIKLPSASIALFISIQDSIYAQVAAEMAASKKSFPTIQTSGVPLSYRVKNGDYLGKIAGKYTLKISDIKKWNKLKSNHISIGQRLTLYPNNTNIQNSNTKISTRGQKAASEPLEEKTYVVANGDSLWSIAQRISGVSVADLKKWNDIWDNKLKPGATLKLCSCSP
ncbi:MAG: membrane-bound lytic murein transglycosylase D [Flavobacteriaceae bacterium]|jgi:membrane-bound lytic murein transglycosylase D